MNINGYDYEVATVLTPTNGGSLSSWFTQVRMYGGKIFLLTENPKLAVREWFTHLWETDRPLFYKEAGGQAVFDVWCSSITGTQDRVEAFIKMLSENWHDVLAPVCIDGKTLSTENNQMAWRIK